MSQSNEEFAKKLMATFQAEAEEHLRTLTQGILSLEQTSDAFRQGEALETVFRESHSLKGAARTVNFGEMETLCRALEDIFSAMKTRQLVATPLLFDQLHSTLDTLRELLRGRQRDPAVANKILELLQALESYRLGVHRGSPLSPMGAEVPAGVESSPGHETLGPHGTAQAEWSEGVRIRAARLNALLLEAEELLAMRLALAQRVEDLRHVTARLDEWEGAHQRFEPETPTAKPHAFIGRDENAESSKDKGILQDSNGSGTWVRSLDRELRAVTSRLEADHRAFLTMSERLLGDLKGSLMLPFHAVLEPFPKLARDLARAQGKEVEFVVRGAEIEVDRRVLETLKDPLMHLIRNAVDHGIESPEQREQVGKSRRGLIELEISQRRGGRFELVVSDDGNGIGVEQVRQAALKQGVASAEMSETAVCQLIFRSGISTSPAVTDLSGRGLGLAIVDEKVRNLGGSISLETNPGRGTTFRILLPVTMAAFRGVLVRASGRFFILPTAEVQRVVRIGRRDVKTVENRETIRMNDHPMAVVRLADAIKLDFQSNGPETPPLTYGLVLTSAGLEMVLQVDEILREQEVVVRALPTYLAHLKIFAGAAVLGSGQLVPILNTEELVKLAVKASPRRSASGAATEHPKSPPSVLVAEDSVTARTLLKHILESAGFRVKTAVDGLEAYTLLRAEPFNLLVSDVDMPRMSGFDLTAKIRADGRLKDLPVVLMTALESEQDRERGMQAGANAYLTKSRFDQSHLLEVIRRLV